MLHSLRIREKILETYTNKLIFLEEPHEYYLDGVQYMCVSDVTHKYKPITGEQMAENCVKKWQRDQDPTYKYYGLTKEEIIAFGDGENDLEMLAFAGVGVAMGNADEEVKEVADYVTTEIDDDGIWNACKHFKLI